MVIQPCVSIAAIHALDGCFPVLAVYSAALCLISFCLFCISLFDIVGVFCFVSAKLQQKNDICKFYFSKIQNSCNLSGKFNISKSVVAVMVAAVQSIMVLFLSSHSFETIISISLLFIALLVNCRFLYVMLPKRPQITQMEQILYLPKMTKNDSKI